MEWHSFWFAYDMIVMFVFSTYLSIVLSMAKLFLLKVHQAFSTNKLSSAIYRKCQPPWSIRLGLLAVMDFDLTEFKTAQSK